MKLKHTLLTFFILGQQFASAAQDRTTNASSADLQRPNLVVGIVVDQMRWDYLYRYYDRYGQTGFRRMLNEGFTCENTNIGSTERTKAPWEGATEKRDNVWDTLSLTQNSESLTMWEHFI